MFQPIHLGHLQVYNCMYNVKGFTATDSSKALDITHAIVDLKMAQMNGLKHVVN